MTRFRLFTALLLTAHLENPPQVLAGTVKYSAPACPAGMQLLPTQCCDKQGKQIDFKSPNCDLSTPEEPTLTSVLSSGAESVRSGKTAIEAAETLFSH